MWIIKVEAGKKGKKGEKHIVSIHGRRDTKKEAGEKEEANRRLDSFNLHPLYGDFLKMKQPRRRVHVKTILGPKGMDKILQSTGRGHSVTVTNYGATILKSLHIDNPAAKVLIDISKIQDDEVGNGTTSVVVLVEELLREAENDNNFRTALEVHCWKGSRITWKMQVRIAYIKDNSFVSDLMKIAMTTLSSKILSQDKEHFATLAVDAVMRLKGSTNLESIQIIKKAGGVTKVFFLG
nr:T-complex protein 1 subunit beta [Tanacetum cinerariifolium]